MSQTAEATGFEMQIIVKDSKSFRAHLLRCTQAKTTATRKIQPNRKRKKGDWENGVESSGRSDDTTLLLQSHVSHKKVLRTLVNRFLLNALRAESPYIGPGVRRGVANC